MKDLDGFKGADAQPESLGDQGLDAYITSATDKTAAQAGNIIDIDGIKARRAPETVDHQLVWDTLSLFHYLSITQQNFVSSILLDHLNSNRDNLLVLWTQKSANIPSIHVLHEILVQMGELTLNQFITQIERPQNNKAA